MTASPRSERRTRATAAQAMAHSGTKRPPQDHGDASPPVTEPARPLAARTRTVHCPDCHDHLAGPPRRSQDARCGPCRGTFAEARASRRVPADRNELPLWIYR